MKSLPRWSIRNAPALNIVLIAVMVVGWFAFKQLRRESFPEFELDSIVITVPYPGAAPQEVEQGICQKIEEAVRSLNGVDKVTSVAREGSANVVLEVASSVDNPDRVLDEVRSEVDRIPSFPVEAEDPEISMITSRRTAIKVGILAPVAKSSHATPLERELELRQVAELAREELLALDGVTQVEITGARDYQIDIEIPEHILRSHGLTLREVANIVRRENRELPAGSIRDESQEILLRANNRQTSGEEIAKIPLVTQSNGAVLTIGDLGNVRDGFVDTAAISQVNGQDALVLSVQRSSKNDLIGVIDAVDNYVERKQLPTGYELTTWGDESIEVRSRLDLLRKNGKQGLLIVFILLVLFLDLKLAFWVALGIPFTILATGSILFLCDATLNMISMFAFVMAMGIVVDDAIVVGENIFAHRQMGKSFHDAAVDGTAEVVPSVTASVSTTVIAFMPLLFVSGIMGKFMAIMPVAIIAMLIVSLIESVTILPAHLAHRNSLFFQFIGVPTYPLRWIAELAHLANRAATNLLNSIIKRVYAPTLDFALQQQALVIAGCVAMLLITVGIVLGGHTPFNIFPKLDGNALIASLTFPDGTPESVTDEWTAEIEDAFWRVAKKIERDRDEKIGLMSYRVVGQQIAAGGPGAQSQATGSGSHVGSVEIELVDTEIRSISSNEIVSLWRAELGPVTGVEKLSIGARMTGPGGIPVEFKLLAPASQQAQLEAAVEEAKEKLKTYDGIFEVADDSQVGKWEYRFRIKEEAAATGVRTADLAETVRASYFGEEVMRLQRGRHDIKLMVRYPAEDRRVMANFDEIRVRSDDGIERPITELADIEPVRGYSEINRVDQLRSITISADMDEAEGNAGQVVSAMRRKHMPEILKKYPGVKIRWEGQQRQTEESISSLMRGFVVAILAMLILLTLEFKSYIQPLIIVSIIPFGMIGAVLGHYVMQLPLTMFSLFGIVALTGIVVNDSIVLVDFINARVRSNTPMREAIREAGMRRFRPVMLTTVTTIGGLMPILLETSFQAQVLIPMAVSIAFGEMFATVLVLYLVPVAYSIYWVVIGEAAYKRNLREHGRDKDLSKPA
jgi:hydrophobic/amphiphilic exporter-1 (mainly G- bacteria), HAE1 family